LLFLGAFLLAVVAVLAGAALWPLNPGRQPVPRLSTKAFSGDTIKVPKGGYEGSRLVIFTSGKDEATKKNPCLECEKLDKLVKSKAFETKHKTWWTSKTLRMGKVICNSGDNSLVCERFGITGSEGTEPGLPQIVWFKGKTKAGVYDGGRATVGDFTEWVLKKQDENGGKL